MNGAKGAGLAARPVAAHGDPAIERSWLEYPQGIPVEAWGRDHLSTLLYAETRAVDHKGWMPAGDPHMRGDGHSYPTRLHNGVTVHGHSDWECLKDAEAAGFLTYDEDGVPEGVTESKLAAMGPGFVRFTDDGWTFAHALRRKRAEGGTL